MTTRLRKIKCEQCGYVVRVTRSWMTVGLPVCPCGQTLEPEAPADLAFLGRIGPDDMPSRMWTEICRENGWEDQIMRKGAAAKAHERREVRIMLGELPARRSARADHCAYPGCGKWVRNGSEHCAEHSHDHADDLAAMPF